MGLIIPIFVDEALRRGEVLVQAAWLMVDLGFALLTVRLACLSRGAPFLRAAGCK